MPYKKVNKPEHQRELKRLLGELMTNLADNSVRRSIRTKAGPIQYQEFYPARSKVIIDEVDRVLACHYGFSPEELDFIINYDVKYRLGRDAEADDDG